MQRLLLLFALAAGLGTTTLLAQAPTTFIVNSSLDDSNSRDSSPGDGNCSDGASRCTLRAAIDEANATSGEVVIVIPGDPKQGSGTYTLSRVAPNNPANTFEDDNNYGDLDIDGSFSSLTLQGSGIPGPTITVSPNDRILDIISGGTVNVERIQFTGGSSNAGGNGTGDGSGPTGINGQDGANGGAIRVGSGLTVNFDQITVDNSTTGDGGNGAPPASSIDATAGGNGGSGGNGGGLYISSGAEVTINRATFTSNGTGDGGGAASGQASGMAAPGGRGGDGGNGAAIYNAGNLTIMNSTIGNNLAGSPSGGAGGVNGGEDGATGQGGSGGGIASARFIDGTLTQEGTTTIMNTIIARNNAGDDTSNGKQPGADLFDGESNGSSFSLSGTNLLGTNEAVTSLTGSLIGTSSGLINPLFQGLNSNSDEAVPTLALGSGSPAINAGTNTAGSFNFDARGFERPAGGQADIGAREENSSPTPTDVFIKEIDVVMTGNDEEFVEIRNDGDYPVQLDAFVVVGFNNSGSSCYRTDLYGELMPGMNFTIGDMMVDNINQTLQFDVANNSCGPNSNSQFNDAGGAVGLYRGTASNLGSFSAGAKMSERQDVLVYNNGSNLTGKQPSQNKMMDLCGAFGLAAGCAGTDSGDNSSIQVDADGNISSQAPSPGSDNASAALPVEFLSFTGFSPKSGLYELNWQTASEQDNAGFTVEQSTDGTVWNAKGWVGASQGQGESIRTYRFNGTDLTPGTHLFRLAQEDFDGTVSYSDIISLTMDGNFQLGVAPNPAVEVINLTYQATASGEASEVLLFDAAGRMVANRTVTAAGAGVQRTFLDVRALPSGTYFLRVANTSGTRTEVVSVR